MGKNKEHGCTESLMFAASLQRNKLITGLDEQVNNPYKGGEADVLRTQLSLDETWTDSILNGIIKSDTVALQTVYELKDSVSYGYYTSSIKHRKMSGNSVFTMPKRDAEHTYLEKFTLTLYDSANRFSSDTARGRIAIQLLKNHPLVAKDKDSANSTMHHFFIASEEQDDAEQLQIDKAENKAIAKLADLLDKKPNIKYMVASLLKRDSTTFLLVGGDISEVGLDKTLNDYVKRSKDKKEALSNFNRVASLALSNNEEDLQSLFVQYIMRKAIDATAIIVRNGNYKYRLADPEEEEQMSRYTEDGMRTLLHSWYVKHDKLDDQNTYFKKLITYLQNKQVKYIDNL
jgi:hypothetical protein